MNISYPPIPVKSLPPAFEQLGHDLTREIAFVLIPFELIYFAIYFHLKGVPRVYKLLSLLALITLWISPIIVPIACRPMRCVQNFAIAVGTMKTLDFFCRRNSLPRYSSGPTPPDYKLALLYLTEMRYESFTPNQVRTPRHLQNFSEPMQLAIHIVIFSVLSALPQKYPTIVALEIEYAIYILWTTMQLILRYKSSPALFGPLYGADSISGFWSETWHNVFAAPCMTLAYNPLRQSLPKLGIPVSVARVAGVLGAFFFMAVFHIYALLPILPYYALKRTGLFFIINGIGSVLDEMVWRRRKHRLRAIIAWIFELGVSTWAVAGMNLPQGLGKIDWKSMCNA